MMNAAMLHELNRFMKNLNKVMEGQVVIRLVTNYTGSRQIQFVSLNED